MDRNRIKIIIQSSNLEKFNKIQQVANGTFVGMPFNLGVLFESRQIIARKLLTEIDEDKFTELSNMYEYIENDIKRLLLIL